MNRTKQAISDAFWQLLEEKPYNKITVQNIVERCQVNRNTFYYHFSDIPALVEYTVREWTDNTIRKYRQVDSPIQCITALAEECSRRKRAALHLYRSAHREEFTRSLRKMITHMVTFYVNQPGRDYDFSEEEEKMMCWFYECLFMGITLDWLDENMSYDPVTRFEKMYEAIVVSGKHGIIRRMEEVRKN